MSERFWVVQNLATELFLMLEKGAFGLRSGWQEHPLKATLFVTEKLATDGIETAYFLGKDIEPNFELSLIVIPITITLEVGTLVPRKHYGM